MAPFTSNVRTAKRVPCSSEAAPDLHPPGPSASHGDTQPPPPAHTIPGAAQYVWPWTARISHHVPSAKLRVMNCFFSSTARRRFEVVPHSNLHGLFTEHVAATG